MTVKTTYICDHCGHEQDNNKQMWNVSFLVQASERFSRDYQTPKVMELWCRVCTEKFGLLPYEDTPKEKRKNPSPKPSLEDLIRELIRKEMQE